MAERSRPFQVAPAQEHIIMPHATVLASATGIPPRLDSAASLVRAATISSTLQRRLSSEADPPRGIEESQYDRSDISSAVVSTADPFASLADLLMVSHPNGLEPQAKKANHDAIVQHFQLRLIDMESYAQKDDAADGTTDHESSIHSSADGSLSGLFAARRTLRKGKSKRDSMGSLRNLKGDRDPVPIVVSRGAASRRLVGWRRRLLRVCRNVKRKCSTPVSPTGKVAQLRGVVILVTMLTQLFFMPFVPVYYPRGTVVITAMSVVFDIVCLVDLGFSFNTSYYDEKTSKLAVSRRKIAKRYFKTRGVAWVVIDVIAALPIDTLLLLSAENFGDASTSVTILLTKLLPRSFLRCMRWHWLLRHSVWGVRLVKVTKDLSLRLLLQRYSVALHLARVVMALYLASHYVACLWRATIGVDAVVVQEKAWSLYLSDVESAVHLLVGMGAPHTVPMTEGQSVFEIAAVLFGALVIAYVTSAVALILATTSADSGRYSHNVTRALAAMDKMHLPAKLQRRIHQYYDYLWIEHDAIDGDDIAEFAKGLSPSLELEVRLFKYMDLVLGVRFWRNCSAGFVTQIMLRLQVTAYLPEDYVMRQGEIGDTLFLINKGICELRAGPSRDEDASAVRLLPVRRLAAGTAFGEVALLLNYRRTATVRALTFVEMCVLQRSAFQEVLLRYRDDRREVLREILQSTMEKKGQHFVPFPWEELVATTVATTNRKPPANAWEAAELIVDLIQVPDAFDDSIKFGFRDLDQVEQHRLRPATRGKSTDEAVRRLHKVEQWQRETSERLSALEKNVSTILTLLTSATTSGDSAGTTATSAASVESESTSSSD